MSPALARPPRLPRSTTPSTSAAPSKPIASNAAGFSSSFASSNSRRFRARPISSSSPSAPTPKRFATNSSTKVSSFVPWPGWVSRKPSASPSAAPPKTPSSSPPWATPSPATCHPPKPSWSPVPRATPCDCHAERAVGPRVHHSRLAIPDGPHHLCCPFLIQCSCFFTLPPTSLRSPTPSPTSFAPCKPSPSSASPPIVSVPPTPSPPTSKPPGTRSFPSIPTKPKSSARDPTRASKTFPNPSTSSTSSAAPKMFPCSRTPPSPSAPKSSGSSRELPTPRQPRKLTPPGSRSSKTPAFSWNTKKGAPSGRLRLCYSLTLWNSSTLLKPKHLQIPLPRQNHRQKSPVRRQSILANRQSMQQLCRFRLQDRRRLPFSIRHQPRNRETHQIGRFLLHRPLQIKP